MVRRTAYALLALALIGTGTACARSVPDPARAAQSRGPITVWVSNNIEEMAWGKKMVADWNGAHPGQKIKVQSIPAGKTSEESLSASIIAGTSACLVFNTSPASVPQFEKQAGLVPLDDFPGAEKYIEERSGSLAGQYRSEDGKYRQMPWKSNPGMLLYNKDMFRKAGLDPERPQLATYDAFLRSAQKIVDSGAAKSAIWPMPSSEFFQTWFDFYPAFVAESGGKQLVEDGRPQFDSRAGREAGGFWRDVYARGLAPKEGYSGDAFAEGKTAMATGGPWAVAAYKGNVDWGVVPMPTSRGKPADEIRTFSDQKSAAMFSSCENRATAWDVLKFATSPQQDGKFLDATGQMPMREDLLGTYRRWFEKNPDYKAFARQAENVVDVPNIAGSIDIWQAFRDAWTRSVVFGRQPVQQALREASDKTEKLIDAYGDPS